MFVAVALTDFCWTRYIQATAEAKANQSALFSLFIILIGGFVAISYTTNHWLLIPAGLGAYVGTYLTVKYHHGPKD